MGVGLLHGTQHCKFCVLGVRPPTHGSRGSKPALNCCHCHYGYPFKAAVLWGHCVHHFPGETLGRGEVTLGWWGGRWQVLAKHLQHVTLVSSATAMKNPNCPLPNTDFTINSWGRSWPPQGCVSEDVGQVPSNGWSEVTQEPEVCLRVCWWKNKENK